MSSNSGFTQNSPLDSNMRPKLISKRQCTDGICSFCSGCNSSFFRREDFTLHIKATGCGGKERFPCNFCNKIFSYSWNLKSHLEVHDNSGQKYTCETCHAKFTWQSNLIRHLSKKSSCKYHLSTFSSRICSICNCTFITHQDFKQHLKTVRCGGKESFPCDICNKRYSHFYELKRHKESHEGKQKEYICDTCHADFTLKSRLISHLQKKSNCKRFKDALSICSVCNSSFTKREGFRLHIRTVRCGGKERFPCQICNKSYSHLSDLKSHLEVHNVLKKKYTCETCNAEYTLKSSLTQHKRKKSNCERNLSNVISTRICSICNSSFTKPEDFRNHVKTVGCKGKARFPCNICNTTFSLLCVLRKHKEFHKEVRRRYFCATCNAVFRLKSKLIIHLSKKSNCENKHSEGINSICNVCNSSFTSRADFKQHIKVVECGGNERFLCNICNSSFSYFCALKIHKELHDNTRKKYVCETCNAEFNQKGSLMKHLMKKSNCGPNLSNIISSTCSVCSSSFTKRNEFKKHFKTVRCGGKERFPCSACTKSYSSSHGLKKHQEVHNETAQKYSGEACNAEFTLKSDINKHFRQQSGCGNEHSKRVSRICSVCVSSFTTREDFQMHAKTVRCGGSERFMCATCNASFSQPGNLRRHQEIHKRARKNDVSETNNAKTTHKSSYNHHLAPQNNEMASINSVVACTCNYCNSSYSKQNFQNHIKSVGCGNTCVNVQAQSILGDNLSVTAAEVTLPVTSASCSQIQSGVKLLPSVSGLEHTYKVYIFRNTNSSDFSTFVSSKMEDIKNTIRANLESHCNEKLNATAVTKDVEYIEIDGKSEGEIVQTFGTFRSKFIPILNTQEIDNSVKHIMEEALSNFQKGNNII